MTANSEGRQGARFGVRVAILGLIDHVPGGPIGTRIIEDRWPTPREREQAARIVELEGKLIGQ